MSAPDLDGIWLRAVRLRGLCNAATVLADAAAGHGNGGADEAGAARAGLDAVLEFCTAEADAVCDALDRATVGAADA